MKPFGKYQLVRRIAAGGMAEVYLATGPNPRGDELLALKLILQHIAEDEAFQAMFLQEAKLTAPLTHPNLVQIFDLGINDGRLYLAMEYIRGRPLSEVLRKSAERGQGMGPVLAAAAVRQACLGLHYAHEAKDSRGQPLGLVHRDVSPQNLMLDQAGVVKVVDFGVAKATMQSEVSRAGSLKGKVGYMAPEQLKSKPIDRRADVFALGAVLFELAAGKPLYDGRTDAEVLQKMLFEAGPSLRSHGLPEPLVAIIERAIDRDRAKRYPTGKEMAEALDGFLGEKAKGGPKQLAALVGALFPPLPNTLAEAEAEAEKSQAGKKTGNGPLVIRREDVVGEAAGKARPTSNGGRVVEKTDKKGPSRTDLPVARPPTLTGPTDPAGRPGAMVEERTVKADEVSRPGGKPRPRPAPSDENMPTDQVKAPKLGPNGLVDLSEPPDPNEPPTRPDVSRKKLTASVQARGRAPAAATRKTNPIALADVDDEEEATVSTVSDSVRPRPTPPGNSRLLLAGGAGAALLVAALGLLWKLFH